MRIILGLLSLPLLAQQQWNPVVGTPSTRIFEIHDASAFTGIPGCIAMSSRATISGNQTGLWTLCPLGWKQLSALAVSSFVVTNAGDIVFSQLTGPAQQLPGPSVLPITRLPKGGGAAITSTYQGDVRRMAINRTTGTLYALQVDGSVYTSTDGGTTWTASNPQTHFMHADAIGGLGVRSSDGLVLVCDEVEPCESFASGSWTGVGAAPNSGNVVFGPDNSAWSADSNATPQKWDGSGTWNNVNITTSFTFRMHGSVVIGPKLCFSGRDISTNAGPHVYCSQDNGVTWLPFETGIAIVAGGDNNAIALACDGTLYMGTDQANGALYAMPAQGPNTCGSAPPPPPSSVIGITVP